MITKNDLKQLIPGSPGTSFVVALLYLINKKYKKKVANDEQLSLFTKGIINCRRTCFSGVVEEVAKKFKLKIFVFSNGQVIVKWAKEETHNNLVEAEFNYLNENSIELLLDRFTYLVLAVDLYFLRGYHDYHFVCINKEQNGFKIFDPKSGTERKISKEMSWRLFSSIREGLNDVSIAFGC